MTLESRDIIDVWRRIEAVFRVRVPIAFGNLRAGADTREIARLESVLGVSLPDDLRQSLRVHNGNHGHFTDEGDLLGLADIEDFWRLNCELDAQFRQQYSDWGSFSPWWKATCVPFAANNADLLCVDMDPALGPRVGEVASFVVSGGLGSHGAASYGAWLASVADRLEAGTFALDEWGGVWLDVEALRQIQQHYRNCSGADLGSEES